MINYSSYAAEELRNMLYNGEQLADIEDASNLAERLLRELEDLSTRLDSCIQRVKAKIYEMQSKMNSAQNAARQAEAAANAAANELMRTPRTKKLPPRAGQPPTEVPANQEKISALQAKIAQERQKAAEAQREIARLQEKINLLSSDANALAAEQSALGSYIHAVEELLRNLGEARMKADMQCKDYVMRDIEKAVRLMEKYSDVRFSAANWGDVSHIREKE